ncbi:hypothetical protein N7447_001083 [Penicillium robsamsonii]|uniref:uncharacterized protein n=1 Tax=Penicillium robsamsonii TaxID=1792511 RepID=UPI0025498058|nr:uncharacterized protein N7447_001083 [Penicillium robsamsonii]KAJ5835057.1 hypothetical protein N7447_001083 [Penicillium robsamsonii]
MGSFLIRGWILAAIFVQTSLATTILAEPTVTLTPAAVGTHHKQHHHHHHRYHNHHHCSRFQRDLYSNFGPCSYFTKPSVVVSATGSLSTGPSQVSGSPSQGATTGIGLSSSHASISTSISDSSTTTVASMATSTVFSTRTATITACPITVPNCPATSKTIFVATETILVSTTICPVTETTGPTQTAPASLSTGNAGGSDLTTSIVYTTRTATITACPFSVTICPLKSKPTHVVIETLVVSTTVCPVADATNTNGAVPTKHTAPPSVTEVIGDGNASSLTTSTVFTTIISTVLACPESVTDYPLRSKTFHATTEPFAVATTIYPVAANPRATGVTPGSQSGPGKDTVHTTTIIVESCSDNDTCTGYIKTIVMTQTNTAAPTAAPSLYALHRGSGTGSSGAVSASSTHLWFPRSHPSGMATTAVSILTSTVSSVYTGAASVGTQLLMMQVVGTMMVMMLAIYI